MKQLFSKDNDNIGLVYRHRRMIALLLVLLLPLYLVVSYINSSTRADSIDEPYSIVILAGQSNATGVNAFRNELPAGNGLLNQHHPADSETKFWYAQENGQGGDIAQLSVVFPALGLPGTLDWRYSGGDNTRHVADSFRLENSIDANQIGGFMGAEVGLARTLYDQGRRKVIVLKVTFGLQSLAQSNSPMVPFDWNVNSNSGNPEKPKSYQQLKDQFNQLTGFLKSRNEKYTVDGIYWMQGETDMLQDAYANAYQQNLTDLVNNAKEDLQLHPYGHFVIGKSNMNPCIDGSFPRSGHSCDYPLVKSFDPFLGYANFPNPFAGGDTNNADLLIPTNMSKRQEIVRAAQQAVADSDANTTQKVDIVETFGLTRGYDYTHLNGPGQLGLGLRFGNMFKLPFRRTDALSNDYDNDGILNSAEDSGRGENPVTHIGCPLIVKGVTINAINNGNLGDDDSDCDGYPNYLDAINGVGTGI